MKEEFKNDYDYLDLSLYEGCILIQGFSSKEELGNVVVERYKYKDLVIGVTSRNCLNTGWRFTYSIHHNQSLCLLTDKEQVIREFLDMYHIYLDPYKF